MMAGGAGPSSTVVDAVGYAGGAVLALCLLPQVAKIVIVRSARDISVAWSVMYLAGLALSITYLIMKNAMAAWLPMVLEVVGCILILALKLFYEHTETGRRFSSAKLPVTSQQLDGSVRGAFARSLSGAGRSPSLDGSVRGALVKSLSGAGRSPSLDGSVRGALIRSLSHSLDKSWHGSLDLSVDQHQQQQQQQPGLPAAAGLEIVCECGSSAASDTSASTKALATTAPQQQQQQPQQAGGLFGHGWTGDQPVMPV